MKIRFLIKTLNMTLYSKFPNTKKTAAGQKRQFLSDRCLNVTSLCHYRRSPAALMPYDNQKSLMVMGALAAILTPVLYFVAKMFLT